MPARRFTFLAAFLVSMTLAAPTHTALAADPAPAGAAVPREAPQLPIPDAAFAGVAKRTLEGSKPDYPRPVTAPAGAPNVLLVLIDDAGFGNPSTFGGPCRTPTMQRLADEGLRYNGFHVCALCSPTRAALITGRNHHAVGFGSVAEFAGGWPGYNATIPRSCATIGQILQANGYSTAAFGKWHLTPDNCQGAAGPFDRWPNGLGFDYFFGFLGGASGQYDTIVTENNTILGVPRQKDYYFPDDMTEHTIRWIHDQKAQSPDKPFFIYYSTGASHAPHHVSPEWTEKYRGKFDEGWDKLREETFARQKQLGVIPPETKLTSRDPAFPAWDSLKPDEKKLYSRQMEVYAGYQENADYQVGRVVKAVEDMGQADNTIIFYIWGDNGASMEGTETGAFNEMTTLNGVPLTAEQQLMLINRYGGIDAWGGPHFQPHYAAAWAWAGNTPFQWGKQVASHLGGTRDPMVIRWPGHIKDRGGLRSQFAHVIDVAPTILDAAGIAEPQQVNGIKQTPMHGVSFAQTFNNRDAKSRHTQQYFEIFGNRGMYKDGWMACARLDRIPWQLDPKTMKRFAPGSGWDPDKDKWELYNLNEDFSEANDLAAQHPEKLAELKALFFEEADKYQATPLLGGMATMFGFPPPAEHRAAFTYYPGTENISSGMVPPIYSRPFSISADLDAPAGAEGVIVAEGDVMGGFALYVQDGKLHYTYSFLGVQVTTLTSNDNLLAGKVDVRYEFKPDQPGKPGTGGHGQLLINGKVVAGNHLAHTVPFRFSSYSGMDIGKDNGDPVSPSYAAKSPFAFTGKIGKVTFEVNHEGVGAAEQQAILRERLARAIEN